MTVKFGAGLIAGVEDISYVREADESKRERRRKRGGQRDPCISNNTRKGGKNGREQEKTR